MVDLLNSVGILITAFATVAVAGFSLGTLKLYQRERKRDAEHRGRLAARLYRLRTDFLAFATVLEDVNDRDSERLQSVVEEMAADIKARQDLANRLLDSAEGATMQVVAYLDVALLELREIETLLRVVADELIGELEVPIVVGELIEKLTAASSAAAHAYLSLPKGDRGWGDGGQYHEVLEQAMKVIHGDNPEESALAAMIRARKS